MSPEVLFLLTLKIRVYGLISSGYGTESPGPLVPSSQRLYCPAGAAHNLSLLSSAHPFKVDPTDAL